ncbi:tetratricopeptide repeat protein [Dokdonella sp.]|uniref:YfgM family protein n=1 Tax=Dokdonella sp. TaxID=2291710 RepID=UPI001B1C97CC|nr:tetratricopeptide repeat protein [Dokdonella sp.]MBO9664530.1 tetratricopeptide repeat protein [Dokdonella sp.]
MAFDDLDEHEQGELARKWLRENAVSIVVGVLLGIVLLFGWQQWKARQARHTLEAAAQFQALSDAVEAKRDDDVGKIAETLRKDFPNSAYAVFAAMHQADGASKKNDLAGAAAALEWARANAGADSLKALASLRLAQVKLAQDDANGALALLDGITAKGEYEGLGNEIRGDVLVKLGRTDDARKAYQDALTNLDAQAPNRNYVQMKLDDLGASAAAPASAPAKEKLGS